MATFMLVHGAWQSAGTWDLLTPLLTSQGHSVVVPALEGLGIGNQQLTPEVSLIKHIQGVAAAVSRSPEPAVLVGHSYAGMVITGACELAAEKVGRLVYLDAFLPEDGQSALDLLPEAIGSHFRRVAQERGEGWRLPGGEDQLNLWGLKEGAARDFVRARLCDFSLRCFEEPVRLPLRRSAGVPSSYVACVAEDYPAKPFFGPFAEKARKLGWAVDEVETGHDCHVERPEAIASLLLSAVA